MARDRKLKAALDRHRGIEHDLKHQKKLQKQAEKRKRSNKHADANIDTVERASTGAEEEVDAALRAQIADEEAAAARADTREKVNGEADGWETDGSEEEVDDEDGEGLGVFDDESDSDSAEDGLDGQVFEGSEQDEDIPLSDLESLSSEDKVDMVPHQRLTINNTAALTRSLKSFALPAKLPFAAVQVVTSTEPTQIADVDDDLTRELAFYKQSLDAVNLARGKLKSEGVPFSRPLDYFAEMVKSEEQMGKVKQKLVDEAARKKASSDARRQRDLKKFGKAVQIAKLQERDRAKRETLDKINVLKRKRQGGVGLTANEDDMFDVALEDATETARKDKAARRVQGAGAGPNRKRQKKDDKYGFGGKKRFAKSNDAKSSGDTSGYSVKRMKGKGGKPQRPGKSRRAKMS